MVSRTRTTPGYTYRRLEREQQSAYVCLCGSDCVSMVCCCTGSMSVTATVSVGVPVLTDWCNWDFS